MQRRSHLVLLALCILLPLPLARSDEAAEQLVLATYKLANQSSTASGTVVRYESEEGPSQSFVVTAHHVFDQMRGDSCVLVSRNPRDDGQYQRQEIQVSVRKAGRPLWREHAKHDLAVLPLPSDVNVKGLPFDSLVTAEQLAEVHVGDGVRLAVFPERAEANNAGFPILRSGSIASFPVISVKHHPIFLVDTTAWTGDSGGPVIHGSLRSPSGGPLLVGIVRGMRSVTDTVKESRFAERRTHYPLGISEVLHAAMVRELIAKSVAEK